MLNRNIRKLECRLNEILFGNTDLNKYNAKGTAFTPSRILKMKYILLLFAALTIPLSAHAACEDPDGEAGFQVYNSTHNVMQYCDGDKWIGMGGGGGGGEALLPDQTTSGACSEDSDQKLRRNTSASPITLEICDWQGGTGDWTEISGGGGGSLSCRVVSAANSVSCDPSEFVTGGGCQSGTALSATRPSGNGFSCSNASGAKTAYAICCTNTGSGGGSPNLITVLTQGNTAGGQKITGLAAPTASTDAAHKTYVDTYVNGKFGTLTNNKWCRTNGTQVICDQDAPAGDGDTLAGLGCAEGQIAVKTAGGWGCADMPGGGGGAPTCGGVTVGSGCWYAGAKDQDCITTCATHGGCNETATRTAGSGGTAAFCKQVLDALGGLGTGTPGAAGTMLQMGCFAEVDHGGGGGITRFWASGSPPFFQTTCAASQNDARRACACNE